MTTYEQQQHRKLQMRIIELEAEVKRLNTPTDFDRSSLIGFDGVMPDQDTVYNKHGQKFLAGIKSRGKGQAIKSCEIEEKMGVPGTVIRSLVHQLRREGHWICSSKNGYWWGTRNEIEATRESLAQRVRSIWSVVKGLDNSLSKPAKQEKLF